MVRVVSKVALNSFAQRFVPSAKTGDFLAYQNRYRIFVFFWLALNLSLFHLPQRDLHFLLSISSPLYMSSFVVRPTNSDKDAFRVRLTAVSLLGLRLKPGDTCQIHGPSDGPDGKKKLAIAWEASGQGLKDTVVQTSKLLQEIYGLRLGDKIAISPSSQRIEDSSSVTLLCDDLSLDAKKAEFWQQYATSAYSAIDECIAISQKLSFRVGDDRVDFRVKDVGVENSYIARVTRSTSFRITNSTEAPTQTEINFCPVRLAGLEKQVAQLQSIIRRLTRADLRPHSKSYSPKQGVLLYGAKGTGKSTFIQSLAESGWPSVIKWTPQTKLSPSNSPRLVIVSSNYISRRSVDGSASQSNQITAIHSLFEQVKGTPTLVVAEISHPNDIDESLRSVGKFKVEIELPIPSALQRKQILWAIRADDLIPKDDLLQTMAERTHGFVGADLYDLFCTTLDIAIDRRDASETIVTANGDVAQDDIESCIPLEVSSRDFELALSQTRPSALQEIFLETPNVHWSDIGGQHEIKRSLQNAIERPLKHADRMAEFGLEPKKGVLLYGPPGCSKTLLVKALATEAKLNFLAVKGAELISMYVGESERATREIFRKARAASPSIIFFDEIDSIASRGRSGGDLNVLTTLLNEMDGFEELKGVMVVAATNKPMAIDPALMRPGRFDNVVYIGPPDLEARREILEKRLGRISYRPAGIVEADAARFAELTEGFSGAEVVGIMQTAGELAFDTDHNYVGIADVEEAIKRTPKSITREILDELESWNAARRGS